MKWTLSLILALTWFAQRSAHSWEVSTHAAITKEALARSTFVDPAALRRLGLGDRYPLGATYLDVAPGAVRQRTISQLYESELMRREQFSIDPTSLIGWIIRGAVREDDNPRDAHAYPDDHDPYGEKYRVIHHFFDPAFDRGLTVLGVLEAQRSPDWALGTSDAFATTVEERLTRDNHFAIFNAREAMWRALTGRQKDGTDLTPPNGMSRSSMRRAYWATAFRSLGDVLHLNQDMSQPQHTRNDSHADREFGDSLRALGNRSVIESYIDLKYSGAGLTLPGNQPVSPPAFTLGDYPIPTFQRYSDYWSTSVGAVRQGALEQGRGLADFSNREFFTTGKNLGSLRNEYASPPLRLDAYTTEVVANPLNWAGQPVAGTLTLFKRPVADAHVPSGVIVPATTASAWDQFFQPAGRRWFTLNHYVYRAQAQELLPRAIAYSAGLINYFFRGRLEIRLPAEGVYAVADHSLPAVSARDSGGFRTLRANVRNLTAGEQLKADGSLVAVARFRRNRCYTPVTLEGEPGSPAYDTDPGCRTEEDEITVSELASLDETAINAAGGQDIAFVFPDDEPIPVNATDLVLQVVYRGPLGTEPDAVVVETRDISEPSFFSFDNHSDCFGGPGTPLASMQIRFNGSPMPVATTYELAGGRYSRLVLLTDPYRYTIEVSDAPGTWNEVIAVTNQTEGVDGAIVNPTRFRKGRPETSASGNIYGIDGYGYYNYVLGPDGQQDGFLGAQACAPIDPQPQPIVLPAF